MCGGEGWPFHRMSYTCGHASPSGAFLLIYPYDFCLYPLVTPLQERCRANSKARLTPALCRAGNTLHCFLLSHMNQHFIREDNRGGTRLPKGGNASFLMLGRVRPLFRRGEFSVREVWREDRSLMKRFRLFTNRCFT